MTLRQYRRQSRICAGAAPAESVRGISATYNGNSEAKGVVHTGYTGCESHRAVGDTIAQRPPRGQASNPCLHDYTGRMTGQAFGPGFFFHGTQVDAVGPHLPSQFFVGNPTVAFSWENARPHGLVWRPCGQSSSRGVWGPKIALGGDKAREELLSGTPRRLLGTEKNALIRPLLGGRGPCYSRLASVITWINTYG